METKLMPSASKLVVIKLDGSIAEGFRTEVEIGPEGQRATVTCQGHLPANPELNSALLQWQNRYRRLSQSNRITAISITYGGSINPAKNWKQECLQHSSALSQAFRDWLSALSFQAIQQRLREELQRDETIRIVLRTADLQVPQLPWHLWSFVERYPRSEVVFSDIQWEHTPSKAPSHRNENKVRILLILGDSEGIDAESDRQQLSQLQNAEIKVLVEPKRQELTDVLWERGWDILFFAGHSRTESKQAASQSQGRLFINATESLTIEELRYGLQRAIAHNLQLAIFNSCDGLGLAQNLAQLNLPQLVVMREPIPDTVAQTFLKYFLHHFSGGATLNLSVRQAREQLQGLEENFPCASWLPIIYQSPAATPPTWQSLLQHNDIQNSDTQSSDAQSRKPQQENLVEEETDSAVINPAIEPAKSSGQLGGLWSWGRLLAISLGMTAVAMGLQNLGFVRFLELRSFDTLMRLRPQTAIEDPRILVVAVTEKDVQEQPAEERRGSLSDSSLEQLLQVLQQAQPRVIGLDIYRDFPVLPERQKLAEFMANSDRFVAICQHSDPDANIAEVPPPPEVGAQAQGFSDVLIDLDNRVRRHLLSLDPLPGQCLADYALSVELALRYLQVEGIQLEFDAQGRWQWGQAKFSPLSPGQVPYTANELAGHQILLNYQSLGGPERAFHQVTLEEVLSGQVDASFMRDRVVLIGTTASSFKDYVQTPFPGPYGSLQIPGVILQAQMVSQLIDGVLGERPFLWALPRWAIVLGIAGSALLGGWIGQSQKQGIGVGILGLISIGHVCVCWGVLSFGGGWVPLFPLWIGLWGSSALAHLPKYRAIQNTTNSSQNV